MKTNTRIRATSATDAANCRTCQLDKSYVLVHCPVYCIASPPSEVPSGWVHQSQGFQNRNPLSTLPYPYSEHAYRSSESVRNTFLTRRLMWPSSSCWIHLASA